MSRTIDEKVVEMKFDNSNFEANVKTSMSTLDKLRNSLKLTESASSLKNFDQATNKINFGGFNKGIDEVKARISSLDMVANTVLSRLTNSVIDFGKRIITAIPNQIKQGGIARAENIEQAKFQLKGLGYAWEDVEGSINHAVKGTAYGMDAAAKVASQLLASNVKLGTDMDKSLRSISGLAAMTGSSYEEIGHIMTSIAGQGRVMTNDLMQFSTRGINVAAALGEKLGKSEAEIRAMVSKGKIDFQTFANAMDDAFGSHATAANETFSGALSNMKAALSRIGEDFATPGRESLREFFVTMQGVFDNIRAAIKPISKFFGILSKAFFNGINDRLATFNNYFKELGGNKKIAEGLANILMALWERLEVIGEAFGEVFPASSTDGLNSALDKFVEFTKTLRANEEQLAGVKAVATGVFNAFKIVGQVLGGILKILGMIGPKLAPIITIVVTLALIGKGMSFLGGKIKMLASGLLYIIPLLKTLGIVGGIALAAFAGYNVVKAIVNNWDSITAAFKKAGDNIKGFFTDLNNKYPIFGQIANGLKMLFGAIGGLISDGLIALGKVDWQGVGNKIKGFFSALKENGYDNLMKAKDAFVKFGEGIKIAFNNIKSVLQDKGIFGALNDFGNKASEKMDSIKELFGLKKSSKGVKKGGIVDSITGGADNISEGTSLLTKFGDALKWVRENITIGKVAAVSFSVGILKLLGSMSKALDTTVDIGKSFAGIGTALSGTITNAGNVFKLFSDKGNVTEFIKTWKGTSKVKPILQVAIAIGILAASLAVLAAIPTENLIKGGIALGAIVVVLGILTKVMSKIQMPTLVQLSGNILMLGIAIGIIAGALAALTSVKSGDNFIVTIIKLAAAITAMGVFMYMLNKFGQIAEISLRSSIYVVAMAIAIHTIIKSLLFLNDLKTDQLLDKMIFVLAVIALLIPLTKVMQGVKFGSAVGILAIAIALRILLPTLMDALTQVNPEELINLIERHALTFIALTLAILVILEQLKRAQNGMLAVGAMMILMSAAVGVAVIALNGLVKIIDGAKPEVVIASLVVFGAFLMGFVGAMILISKFAGKISKISLSLGAMFIAIGVSINLMAIGMAKLGDMNKSQIEKAGGTVASIVALFALMLLVTQIRGGGPKAAFRVALMFTSMGIALLAIAGAMHIIAGIDNTEGQFTNAYNAIIDILSLFTLMLVVAQFRKKGLKATTGIAMMVGALGAAMLAISVAMKIISTIPAEDMVGPMIAIGGMFVGFFFLLKQAQQIKKSSLKAILGIVAGIVAIGVELMILSLFEWYEILPAAIALTAALIGFSMVLKHIGNMSKFKDKDKLKSLGLMALMLAEIGGILIGLSILPWEQVAASGAALTAVMLAFAKLAKTISSSTGIKMDKMKALLVMSLTLIPIGAALALVATQNWANILAAGVAIVGVLLSLTLMAKVISGSKGLKANKMGPLILMCLTLVPIGAALALVATQNWANILAAGAAIVGVLLSLTLMAKVVSGSKGLKANKMGPLLLMTLALVPISLALTIVASQPWQGILAAMAGISGTLLALAAALAIVSATKVSVGNAAAFALASLAIVPIGAALALLSMFPWQSMLAAMLSASVVMIALAAALAIIAATKVNIGNAAAFLVASLGVVAIGAALAMIATQPWPQILAAMGAVVGVMITLGIVLGLLAALPAGDLVVTSAAVLIACIGVAAIGAALAMLATQPWESILASMGAVIGVMVSLGILLGLLSALAATGVGAVAIIVAAGAIALLGLAVQMAGQGLLSGAMGINMFIGSLMLMQAIDMASLAPNIGQLALALIEIGAAGLVLSLGAMGLIMGAQGIMMLGVALPLFASLDFNSMSGGMLQFAAGLGAIGLAALTLIPSAMFINTFAMGIAMMAPALVLLNTCQNLTNVGLGLSSIATALLQMIPTAMIIMPIAMGMMMLAQALIQISMASMQASMTLTMAITSFQLALTTMQTTLQTQTMQKYFEIGTWIPKSMASGILANAPNLISIAARVAQGVENAIRDTLGIHSKSEKIEGIGEWVNPSFGSGMMNNADDLFKMVGAEGAQIPEELSSGILGNMGSAESAGASLGSGVGSALESAVTPFINSAKEKLAGIMEFVGNVTGNVALKNYGTTMKEKIETDKKAKIAQEDLTEGSRRFEQQTNKNKTATSELNDVWEKFFGTEKDVTEESKNGADAADGYADSLNGLGGAAGGASEAMGGLADTIANQMDLFEEFNMNTELTGEQLLNNMRSQIQGVSQWAANMQELALRGMAPGLYKKLMDLGPQGYEKVNAFMQMNAAQLAEANQLYATSLTLPGFAAKQVEGGYGYTGEMAAQGFANGLGGYEGGRQAADGFGLGAIDQVENESGVESPSWKTKLTGGYLMEGLSIGMANKWPETKAMVTTICNSLINTFDTFFKDPANSMRMGQSIMQGFLTGMNTLAAEGGLNAQTLANTLLTVFSYDLGYNGLIEFVQGMIDYLTESFLLEDGASGYMYQLAQALVDGLKLWFEENGEDFLEFVDEEWLTPLKDKIDEYIGEDAAAELGMNLVMGLKKGIEENAQSAIDAATELGKKVNQAYKDASGEASPSKVFYGFGRFLDMGLANGIRAYTKLPVDAVSRMGDTINTIASRVSSAIDGSMDMSPVIRPVLDTTNISNGIGMMNSMFGSAQARVSATATGYAEAMRLKAAQLELSKNAQNKLNASYANALVDAVNSISNTDTNVNVVLAGDAAGVFKLVRTENSKFVKSTGYAPLAQRR